MKYGLLLVPYLLLAFVIFKNQEESKVQLEVLNQKVISVTQENTKLEKDIVAIQKENVLLKKEVESQKQELKTRDKEVASKVITEKFDSVTGKVTERTERDYASRESSKQQTSETSKSKTDLNKSTELTTKETSKQEVAKEIKTAESTEKTISYQRKKYGVNLGIVASMDGSGPLVSYSVIPLTSQTSIDIGAGFINKPVVGVQISATVVEAVGIGVGAYIPPEDILKVSQGTAQIIPGASLQYRF